MVAAEARASGVPLIVPDRGAASDQLVAGAGIVYRSGNEASLVRAIGRFIEHGPELQRARAAHHSRVRTMDEHFEQLFERYASLNPGERTEPVPDSSSPDIPAVPSLHLR
jgi:alpha-1,6-mannosyltransferase